MRSVYLFIDGGHLRKRYREATSEWFAGEGKIDFARLKKHFEAEKCFYYDCLDDVRRPGENAEAREAIVEEQKSYFNIMREIPGYHLRLGSLVGEGKRRRQKGVDILLAVDMLNHAVRDNLLRATLLSGDGDFKPVIDSLVQMGVLISVAGDKSHTSKELAWAADSFKALSFDAYFSWTDRKIQEKYPIQVNRINRSPDNLTIIRTGEWKGRPVTVGTAPGGFPFCYLDVPADKDRPNISLQSNDPDRLTMYFELQFGKVEWA